MATVVKSKNAHLDAWKQRALQAAVDAAEACAGCVADYPPALTPVTVAQFLLESDWGRAGMGEANNYFGIKARDGEPFVVRTTREVINGKTVTVEARFRKYDSMADCFADHARLICERRRPNGRRIYDAALQHPDDPVAFARALASVYATDPHYGDKLVAIMSDRGLLETFGFETSV
jgi:flagellum-specific peptidoglycan hydrolase FlgJ